METTTRGASGALRRGSRRRRATLLVLALTIGALLAPAAATRAVAAAADHHRRSHFRVAWLANDPSNTYDNATLAGIRSITDKSHSTVDPFFAGFDPAVQGTQCRQAIDSKNYDALIIEAASPTQIESCVSAAHAADIPVAATDLPIGPDQTTVQPQVPGEVAASFIPASKFGDGITAILPAACSGLSPCNILYVAGLESFPADQYGLGAVRNAAASNSSVRLIDHGEAFYDTATARQVVHDALVNRPEINEVLAAGDQMALGAEEAAQSLGVHPRILGAGAGASAIDAVRNGRWFATFNALPRTEGRISAALLVRALRHHNFQATGVDPVVASGLPIWWTATTLAQHPGFVPEWPGP